MRLRHSSARDDEVESLRLRLQRLEKSLQKKEDTIDELRGRNYHQRNRHYDDGSNEDTPLHPSEVERYRWRGRDHYDEYNNFSLKNQCLESEGKSNMDDFFD